MVSNVFIDFGDHASDATAEFSETYTVRYMCGVWIFGVGILIILLRLVMEVQIMEERGI